MAFPLLSNFLNIVKAVYKLRSTVIQFKSQGNIDFPAVVCFTVNAPAHATCTFIIGSMFRWLLLQIMPEKCSFNAF